MKLSSCRAVDPEIPEDQGTAKHRSVIVCERREGGEKFRRARLKKARLLGDAVGSQHVTWYLVCSSHSGHFMLLLPVYVMPSSRVDD